MVDAFAPCRATLDDAHLPHEFSPPRVRIAVGLDVELDDLGISRFQIDSIARQHAVA